MLTRNQTIQLKRICEELDRRGLWIGVHQSMSSEDRVLSVAYDRHDIEAKWFGIMREIQRDCFRFKIKMSAAYIIEMLARIGVYGVAICGPRDEPDPAFGAFVAKARYLKHIEREEMKNNVNQKPNHPVEKNL